MKPENISSLLIGSIFFAALFQAVGINIGNSTLPIYAIWIPFVAISLCTLFLFNPKFKKAKGPVLYLNFAFILLPAAILLGLMEWTAPPPTSASFYRAENIVSQSLYAITYCAIILIVTTSKFNNNLLLKCFHASNLFLIILILDELAFKYAGIGIYENLHHGDFRIQHTGQIIGGVTRITGPFYEASILGGYASAVFGFYLVRYLFTKEKLSLFFLITFFLITLRALSSTGFVGIIFALTLVVYFFTFKTKYNPTYKAIILATTVLAMIASIYIGNQMEILAGKQDSHSWAIRVGLDLDALNSLHDNIMGFQYGSVRTSSLLVNILANAGIILGSAFWVFMAMAIIAARKSPPLTWHFLVLIIATHILSIPDIGHPEIVTAGILFVLNWRLMAKEPPYENAAPSTNDNPRNAAKR